ncbi:protein of unknown function (plasmid) [Caballeronia sp. S22]
MIYRDLRDKADLRIEVAIALSPGHRYDIECVSVTPQQPGKQPQERRDDLDSRSHYQHLSLDEDTTQRP